MTMKIDEELGGGDAPLLNQVIVLSDGRRLDGRLGLDGLAGAVAAGVAQTRAAGAHDLALTPVSLVAPPL